VQRARVSNKVLGISVKLAVLRVLVLICCGAWDGFILKGWQGLVFRQIMALVAGEACSWSLAILVMAAYTKLHLYR